MPGVVPAHSRSQNEGAGARGRPGAHAGVWLLTGARARAPRPSLAFEAQCSSLLQQLITRNNAAQPCPPLRLGVLGWAGGAGRGEANGCLFVYGHKKRYWFYTPACFEIKEHFQGGVEASRLELGQRSGSIYFLVPGRAQPGLCLHPCPQRSALGWTIGWQFTGDRWVLGDQGSSCSSMSCGHF